MHEYSLVQSLVGRVEDLVRERRATAVHRVVVSVGELAGLDPELFRTAYDTFRAGTLCAGASMELRTVPARWACPGCGREIPRGAILTCPACDLPARLSAGADEILLETVEMEVP
ncbi:MAG TPA: hydrogenase maturation nickel metallochaperone HypA [Anaeromyxobacteraceae bacterium]|nr:hydrogenase maturation nickel metallochaperone HypA [Anaeromyxobacteraceae bacterium]